MVNKKMARLLAFLGMVLSAFFLFWLVLELTIPNLASASSPIRIIHNPANMMMPAFPIWLVEMWAGNYGISYVAHEPVTQVIQSRLLPTVLLAGLSYLGYLAVSVPLRVFVIRTQHPWLKSLMRTVTYTGFVPTFRLVSSLILFFGITHHILPFVGINNVDVSGAGLDSPAYWAYFHAHTFEALRDILSHLVLPIVTMILLLLGSGFIANQDALLAPAEKPYTGNPVTRIMHWELANSGLIWSWLISNVIMVEYLFGIPGIGRMFVTSLTNFDVQAAIGTLMTFVKVLLVIMLASRLLLIFLEKNQTEPPAVPATTPTVRVTWSDIFGNFNFLGGLVLTLLVIIAICAPLITPGVTPNTIDSKLIGYGNHPPSFDHFPLWLFGTTGMTDRSRSVLTEVVYGLRGTLLLSIGAGILAALLGIVPALIRSQTWRKDIADAALVIPTLPLGLFLVFAFSFHAGFQITAGTIIFGLALAGWPIALLFAEQGNVAEILHGTDQGNKLLMFASIALSMIGVTVLMEAALGISGLDLPFPPAATLGSVLANSQNDILAGNWWWPAFPSLFSGFLGVNAVALGLRIRRVVSEKYRQTENSKASAPVATAVNTTLPSYSA